MQQMAKSDVPRKVIVFSCGGGSFYEYEQIRAINEEKCRGQAAPGGSNGKDDGQEESKVQASGDAFFDQILYGADHVFSPSEFLEEV